MTDEILDNPAPETGASEEPTNILNSPKVENAAPQTWPDDWRENMAGGDEKYLKQLQRLNSPMDLGKSYFEAQKKISSYKPAVEKPGPDATPEALKAYRDSIGVPEDPSGYNLDFDDGTVIGEDIKPQLDGFLQFAHESNMAPDTVKSTLSWFIKDVEAQRENVKLANDEARINGIAELKSEWGAEYQGNINAVQSLFTNAPEGMLDRLMFAKDDQGLNFANNPDNIRWLASLAKQLNPTATLVPPGPDQAGSIDAEISKIQAMMNSPDASERNKYWKDDKMQERYALLNKARSR
jgi:hypothetical protein